MKKFQRNSTSAIMAALAVNLLAALPTLGALNGALLFNGTSAYVDTGTAVIPASGDFTVETWFNCSAEPGTRREILSQGTAFYVGIDVGYDSEYNVVNCFTLGADWATTGVIVPAGWHHLALVKSSEDTILYLDGINTLNLGSPISNPDSSALRLGCQYDGTSEYWTGNLDDVRIWNTARSADQIQSNRFATLTGTEPGLAANWQFNEGRGTSCAAVGSNPVTGTLMNGPGWVRYYDGAWTPILQLNGANPLPHTLYDAFTDPGATITTPVVAVAGGTTHCLAARVDGSVVAWGQNNSGQTNVPATAVNVMAVAGGDGHSLALKADGTVIAWGTNLYKQATVVPSSATNVTAIAAGSFHSLALKANGTVIAWGGSKSYGQTNVPASATNVTAISAKYVHSLALKADGTVVAWGADVYGEAVVPTFVTNITAIAAGKFHNLALRADGTVIAWGLNTYGETNVPASATNVTAIAAGDSYSLALKADGTVIAWGLNTSGQTNVPASATNVMFIAAGNNFSLAVKTGGTVIAWGFNQNGQTNTDLLSQTILATAGTVDPDVAGTNTLTYSSTNAFGAAVTTDRTVVVSEAIPPPPSYTLTVGSGSGSGSYTNGQQVTITASNLFAKTFVAWTGDTQTLIYAASVASNTVIMTNADANLTATYVNTTYILTINNGTGGGSYTNTQQVAIAAEAPASGKIFDQWTGDTQYVDSVTSSNVTVTMPAQPITLTATYKDAPYYTLTVTSAHDGSDPAGTNSFNTPASVTLTNSPVYDGMAQYVCVGWTGTGSAPASGTTTNTGLFAVTNDSTLVWLWTTNYWLQVNPSGNGNVSTSGGWMAGGTNIEVTATADTYYHFTGWSGDANTNSSSLTLVMNSPYLVTAHFAPNITTNTATPEWWLAQYGLTNFNADAIADPDLDGEKTWQEYIAGTDPTNKASCFKAVQTNRNVVAWSPVTGRVYSVYWSTNLVKGFTNLATGITYPQGSYTNPEPSPRANFYQIRVQLQ